MNHNSRIWPVFSIETFGLLLLFAGRWTRDRIIEWGLDHTIADRIAAIGWWITLIGAIMGGIMLITWAIERATSND